MEQAEKLNMIKHDLKYLTDDEVEKLFRLVVEMDDDVLLVDITQELNNEGKG